MQNDQSQRRGEWRALDMHLDQYSPDDPEPVRQNQGEREPRYEPNSWPHRGLSSYSPSAQVPGREYFGAVQQGMEHDTYPDGYIAQTQGTTNIPSYPQSSDGGQETRDPAQRRRVDWLDGVPEVHALFSAPDCRSVQSTVSGRNIDTDPVNPIVPRPSVPGVPVTQRLTLEIPPQEPGRIPMASQITARGREPARQVVALSQLGIVDESPDPPLRTSLMAIRNLIEPTPRDLVDRIPQRPPGPIGIESAELLAYARRWSAPGDAKKSSADVSSAPAFHVTGTETNYSIATAGPAPGPQVPASEYGARRQGVPPGQYSYYYDTDTSSPSPRSQVPRPGFAQGGESSQGRPRNLSPTKPLTPSGLGHEYTPHLSGSRRGNIQLAPDPRAEPPAGAEPKIHSYNSRREPSPHKRTYSASSRSSHDHLSNTQLISSKSQDLHAPLFNSPHSQIYASDAFSTRRDSSLDQISPTTTSRSSSIATSHYASAQASSGTPKNLKSTPYYATLRPVPSGGSLRQLNSRESPEVVFSDPLPQAPRAQPGSSSRRRRGSSRPRKPVSTRSMPNLLLISEAGNPDVRMSSVSPKGPGQHVISEEGPLEIDNPHGQGYFGRPTGAHTIGTVTPYPDEDVVMREAPGLKAIDTRLKSVSSRVGGGETSITPMSATAANMWRLQIPQETTPRRAKSVENIGGHAGVTQHPASAMRDQGGPAGGSRDHSPTKLPQSPQVEIRSFSLQELETGRILQEMSTGRLEPGAPAIPIPIPPSLQPESAVGSQQTHQTSPTLEPYRNQFVLVDCARTLIEYANSRFFVGNGPLMQNGYTELAESLSYLGTEMHRMESCFTGQAMQEWIDCVYTGEEYKDLERLTKCIRQRLDEDQTSTQATITHGRLNSLIKKYVSTGRLGRWLQEMEAMLKTISERQAREDPEARRAQRRRRREHRTKGFRVQGEAAGSFFGPGLA